MVVLEGDFHTIYMTYIEVVKMGIRPPSPLKLNSKWLQEVEYVNLVKVILRPTNGNLVEETSHTITQV